MILGLGLMLVVGLQSCAVSVGDSMLGEKASTQGGDIGIFMALLFLVGAAFALVLPLVSLAVFVLAGIFGIAAGASTSFSDLSVWGWVSLALAVLSFFGWREKRRKREESRSRVT
jgi:Flp pilus assembly protein TadB